MPEMVPQARQSASIPGLADASKSLLILAVCLKSPVWAGASKGIGGASVRKWLIGLAVAGLVSVCGAQAGSFVGFRLLDFDGVLVRWGSDSERVTVTYGFVERLTMFNDARNCRAMVPMDELLKRSEIDRLTLEGEAAAAFQMWEQVANIRFERATPGARPDILIGAQRDPIAFAFADVAYVTGEGPLRPIERSLICFNPTKRWKIGFDGNLGVYDLRYTLAHEIGHAIGLDHPGPHGQIMSVHYQEGFRTLQPGDVSGAVRIYGPRRPAQRAASVAN
jgi:hypothetical protein